MLSGLKNFLGRLAFDTNRIMMKGGGKEEHISCLAYCWIITYINTITEFLLPLLVGIRTLERYLFVFGIRSVTFFSLSGRRKKEVIQRTDDSRLKWTDRERNLMLLASFLRCWPVYVTRKVQMMLYAKV